MRTRRQRRRTTTPRATTTQPRHTQHHKHRRRHHPTTTVSAHRRVRLQRKASVRPHRRHYRRRQSPYKQKHLLRHRQRPRSLEHACRKQFGGRYVFPKQMPNAQAVVRKWVTDVVRTMATSLKVRQPRQSQRQSQPAGRRRTRGGRIDPVIGDIYSATDIRPLSIVNCDNRLLAGLSRYSLATPLESFACIPTSVSEDM